MIIIGVHGAIGHGKTTFASALTEIEPNSTHFESSTIIAELLDELHLRLKPPFTSDPVLFANEWFMLLTPLLKQLFDLDVKPELLQFTKADVAREPIKYQKLLEHAARLQRDPSIARQKITVNNKATYRAGLQGFGGYLVAQVSPTIWYDEIVRRMVLARSNGRKLCVVGGLRFPADADTIRKSGGIIVEIVRPNMVERDSQDPTEAFRKQIVSDVRVINNGTEQQLMTVAEQLLTGISEGNLRATYTAS